LPRLRLPLPESTGSDRDELLCTHGFVDRAYSVFLLRDFVSLRLRYCTCYITMTGVLRSPLGVPAAPRSRRTVCAAWLREVNEGTSPWRSRALHSHCVLRRPRPCTATMHCRLPLRVLVLGGGLEDRAPMEVPTSARSDPDSRPQSPTGISCRPGPASEASTHSPYPLVT
jgi:hypothetical protein